jgi:hypothetical protein
VTDVTRHGELRHTKAQFHGAARELKGYLRFWLVILKEKEMARVSA